jgi:hypothetical protein
MVLILSAPVVDVLSFFPPESPAMFLSEKYVGYVTPYRILAVMSITSFLPSAGGLEFPLFDEGTGALLQWQWGALGLCALWGRPPSTSRVADCCSVEELGFQLFDRRDMALLQRKYDIAIIF